MQMWWQAAEWFATWIAVQVAVQIVTMTLCTPCCPSGIVHWVCVEYRTIWHVESAVSALGNPASVDSFKSVLLQ